MASSSPRLVIGIDIGASKTVVSYGRNDEGTQNIDFFRLHNKYIVPTAIAYTSEDSYEIGEDAQAAGTNCVYWLKHMFDESRIVKDSNDKLIGEIVQSACNQLPQRQKNHPSLVVSDFLRGILGSVRATLNSDTTLLNLPWDFVFTHPSTWSENSFQKLKQAVYSAGFAESEGPRINFITEAEAAAVFAANEQASAMTPFNYPHYGVIVVDCGASTLDVTTFFLDQTNPFECQRLTAFTSNACGAVQLQSQIYNALESKQTHSRSTRSNTGLTNFVEWSRKNFPHGPISKPGFYKLSAAEMGKIYDDFTTKVIDHIRQQIACANMTAGGNIVKKLVLVGGLSKSSEISTRINRAFPKESGISVYQPPGDQPVTAVCLGATARGIVGEFQLSFKFWQNYAFCYAGKRQDIISKGDTFNGIHPLHFRWTLARHKFGFDHMSIAEGDGPENKVYKIRCDLSQLPDNLGQLDVLAIFRATVKFDEQHFPPERMLHIAVHEMLTPQRRLMGHVRIAMQGDLS